MSRTMVGLLAAVGAVMSVLAGLIHSHLEPLVMAAAGGASGLAAYLALPPTKKIFGGLHCGSLKPPPQALLSWPGGPGKPGGPGASPPAPVRLRVTGRGLVELFVYSRAGRAARQSLS
jgi:hypothetical protein